MTPGEKPQPSPAEKAALHQNEALRLAGLGKLSDAIQHFHAAIQLRPDDPVWQFNYGLALQHLKQLPQAIAAYRKAVELKPDFFDVWVNLSAALKASGQPDEAVASARQAVKWAPNASGAHLNLGNALKAAGDWTSAEGAYRRALILDPNDPRVRLNLGNSLRELGRLPEAITLLRQAIDRSPNFPEAHRDLAFALLLSGEFHAGWIENEWRWQTEDLAKKRRSFAAPPWSGEDLSGRSILVYTEQGFGDALQFVRYASLLAQRGARVLLECQPVLKRLFETVRGVDMLVVRGETIPQVDFQAPLLSLPRIVGTVLETIPREVSYLKAPLPASDELPPMTRSSFNIGLVWAGNPEHLNDQNRSITLEPLRPLLDLAGRPCHLDPRGEDTLGSRRREEADSRASSPLTAPPTASSSNERLAKRIAFHSLQVGDRSSDLKHESVLSHITDLGPHLRDFAATAAVIERLDLVISVDTSVAHLAGALGKPIWLLLPFAPDWRWMLRRDDSPWYPTMRLFRQARIGDWRGVIERVRAELAA